MHLRLLPEKGKYKFRGVKMEMLVTKFSNRKYRNEGDLFAEPISADNVKLMGEMIALQSLRIRKRYDSFYVFLQNLEMAVRCALGYYTRL